MNTQRLYKRGVCALVVTLGVGAMSLIAQTQTNWPVGGESIRNTRHQAAETQISPANASRLVVKWAFDAAGGVTATPTVSDGVVYFPDWAGFLYAVRADTGKLIWRRSISEYNGREGTVSRVSPAVHGDQLIIGENDTVTPGGRAVHSGTHVMAVDRNTGALRWITQVDEHVAAIITGSPVVHNGVVHIGVSSAEESLATDDAYPCCTFRGSAVALDATTGRLLWKTYMSPDNGGMTGGYSGNAIWSHPAIDAARGLRYVVTGNNYTVPQEVADCVEASQDQGRKGRRCDVPDNYFNSILALDLATGGIVWASRRDLYDAWNVACRTGGSNCPSPAGPDFDFGSGPSLVGDIVAAGQKSGIMWALNARNGAVAWSTNIAPGGIGGGLQWGTATDGQRYYVASSNSDGKEHTLCNGGPTINYGSWAALDARSGRCLWQIPDPQGGRDPGSVSVANGVMYGESTTGHLYAIEAATGRILFSFQSGGDTAIGGPAIVDGSLYWGTGRNAPSKVYAFHVPAAGR
jgi:polyvinyl alcohol dehydrogenase (cytochrome)